MKKHLTLLLTLSLAFTTLPTGSIFADNNISRYGTDLVEDGDSEKNSNDNNTENIDEVSSDEITLDIENDETASGNNIEDENAEDISEKDGEQSISVNEIEVTSDDKAENSPNTYELDYEEKDDGTLRITGYTGIVSGDLVIPEKIHGKLVTEIGNQAFKDGFDFNGKLNIPSSVTTIGAWAFTDCFRLTGDLIIPESVTTIEDQAFTGCSGFTGSLTIPSSVTTIGHCAFAGCSGFTGKLTIPDSVTTIGEKAFYGCSGFTGDLTISSSITTIEWMAFKDCSGLKGKLTIPSSVTTIGAEAFRGCGGFTELTIPSSVTTIGHDAFNGCSGFKGKLAIPSSITTIGAAAFSDCSGFTGDLTIPSSVIAIDKGAFEGCSGFTGDLTIPSSVTTIWERVFNDCRNIKGVNLSSSTTFIGRSAFYGCDSIRTVKFDGSKDEWKYLIEKHTQEGNDVLKNAKLSYRESRSDKKVTSIALKNASVAVGYKITLKPTIKPSNATNKGVTWKSSNKKIATVDKNGKVKGIKAGTAKITATAKDGSKKSATCTVTVKNPVLVKSVKLNKTKATVKKGRTLVLKATISPKNATNKTVTWKSSNKKIATVDKNGTVKGIKAGTVKITATAKDGSKKSATCTVTVK